MRYICSWATIVTEGDDCSGIATTPTAMYYTGSAGTKHREMHSPIENASSRKCTWRRSHNCTPRMAKSAHRKVMVNTPTVVSKSCVRWVVGRTMMYKGGMTILESKSTPTASYHRARCAGRKCIGVHWPAENCRGRFVDKCTMEEITSTVNKDVSRRVN